VHSMSNKKGRDGASKKTRVEKELPPMLMGDILDGVFGGTVKTGVPTLQDLVEKSEQGDPTITPAMSFAEFDELSKNVNLFLAFYEAARDRACAESIMFILEVLEYVSLPDSIRLEKEKEILFHYIVEGSQFQVNLTENLRKEITNTSHKGLPDVFDTAQKHITHMLFRNIAKGSYYDRAEQAKKIKGEKQLRQTIDTIVNERVRDAAYDLLTGKLRFNFLRIRYTMKPKNQEDDAKEKEKEQQEMEEAKKAQSSKEKGVLQVTVVSAKDIPSVGENHQLYFNVRSVVDKVPDKETKQRSSVKKGASPTWNEQFIFDVINDTQVIEFHFWSKQILPNSSVAKITLVVKDILPDVTKEKYIEEHLMDVGTGKINLKIHFLPTI